MRIGIDARPLIQTEYTGIARNIYETISVWMDKYPQHEFFLLSCKPVKLPRKLPENWHLIDSPGLINSGKYWSVFKLAGEIKKLKLDVYWGTAFTLPRRVKGCRYYVSVYDLALFKIKGIGDFQNELKVRLFTGSACRKADKIVTISNSTAKDIEEIFKIPSEKIFVNYLGGLPSERNLNREESNREKIFLFIGTIEPRKNIVTIIHAFEKYADLTGDDAKLMLAGGKGWKSDDIYIAAKNSKYRDRIIMPGFVSDDEKAYLLSHAAAFVYPSLYEGFGIPILEAFAYGLPVITARVSSMPEVAGEAAFYIEDPKDADALAGQMVKAEKLSEAERRELAEKMRRQLNKFSWEENADRLMRLFENHSL